ncbi:alkaline phosphatase family protein [Halomarina halobia]|uniref:Alkaline phosphatase family protein n=1 Tax=Halomarina halobia TaxID=3033386 RepID=A0ABD6A7K6_9EURY|nr:alkaline phosphatase family protein [Halomarina sp. PSR21]
MDRTVVIGLDGFHKDLLPYTPTIQDRYLKNGTELESTSPPVTAPAWASFQTGKTQGKHGIYDFVTFDENFERTILDGRSLRSMTFYESLAQTGLKCYLQNLPFALPPRLEGDIMPSWLDDDDVGPHPSDLASELDVDPPIYPEFDGNREENISEMSACFARNRDLFLSIMEHRVHDFLFHLVSVTDWLQHIAYLDLIDGRETAITEAATGLLRDVDEYVAILENRLDETDNLILISDHGFKRYEGSIYINDWLAEEDYLKRDSSGIHLSVKSDNSGSSINAGTIGRWIRHNPVVHDLIRPAKQLVEHIIGVEFITDTGVDMSRTRAYCRSKDEHAIRIADNVDDREGLAIEIQNQLNQLEGISATLGSDLYEGPYVDAAGDVIVSGLTHHPQRGPVGEVFSPIPIAHHSKTGILVGLGPAFTLPPTEARLIDIAPTLLYLNRCAIPRDCDGEALVDWLWADHDLSYHDSTEWTPPSNDSSNNPRDIVENRLEQLGYL